MENNKQQAIFRVNGLDFKVDEEESELTYEKLNDGKLALYLEIQAFSGRYVSGKGEDEFEDDIMPLLAPHTFEVEATAPSQLLGWKYELADIDTSLELEDDFYIFEHEPMESYRIEILELTANKVHIHFAGMVVEDGYARPYTTVPAEIDCWVRLRETR